MHILVLGAAGMVGRKLTERLVRDGRLGGREITHLTLQDVVAPQNPAGNTIPTKLVTSDFADLGTAAP
ncbi:MAG: NAD-dependent epimerase, partial [Rhizobiales bacterium]|nr:NAD-dependent epimerase [Hyphomicrobiales bacterium]